MLTRNGLIEKQFVVHYFLPQADETWQPYSFNDVCIKKWPRPRTAFKIVQGTARSEEESN